MGSAVPALLVAITAASQVNNAQQQKKKEKLATREAVERSALLQSEAAEQESDRKRRLKSALATQKALFGARGISASSGSALTLANQRMAESHSEESLNRQSTALKLNQANSVLGFNKTASVLGVGRTLVGGTPTFIKAYKDLTGR